VGAPSAVSPRRVDGASQASISFEVLTWHFSCRSLVGEVPLVFGILSPFDIHVIQPATLYTMTEDNFKNGNKMIMRPEREPVQNVLRFANRL
jgi:hypothetical protein